MSLLPLRKYQYRKQQRKKQQAGTIHSSTRPQSTALFTITSNIKTAEYPNGRVAVWTQTLSQTTNNALTSQGNIQVNTQATSGKDSFLLSAETPYTNTYSYPLFANTSVTNLRNGSIRFDAQID